MRSAEGSVFKSKDGRWVARLRYTDAGGFSKEKKRYALTQRLARAKIQELKGEISDEALRPDSVTFQQLDRFYRDKYVHAARFVGGQKVSGFRQSVDTVRHYLDAALDFFGDRDITSITYADVQRFKAAIFDTPTKHGKQRSVSDTNHFLKRLRRLFAVAIEQGWLMVNPFNRGGSLIADSFETKRTRILSAEEETRLLTACERWRGHIVPIIIFAIETGCRRGEIQKLLWSAVNLDRRVITVEWTSTKTLQTRLVPISARLVETLVRIRPDGGNSPVFGGSDFKKAFNAACVEAGLSDVKFHDLRHTAITRMLEKGISPPLVMKISGHTQQRTFMRYVNQSEQSVYEIALKLDAAA